jgi:hypothetical protein
MHPDQPKRVKQGDKSRRYSSVLVHTRKSAGPMNSVAARSGPHSDFTGRWETPNADRGREVVGGMEEGLKTITEVLEMEGGL